MTTPIKTEADDDTFNVDTDFLLQIEANSQETLIKTECSIKLEEDIKTEQSYNVSADLDKCTVNLPKYCMLCQDFTDHSTSKCPTLKCIICGAQGHAERNCQLKTTPAIKEEPLVQPAKADDAEKNFLKDRSNLNAKLLLKHKRNTGRVRKFRPSKSKGSILSKGQKYKFKGQGGKVAFPKGTLVLFDISKKRASRAINVQRVKDMVGQTSKAVKIEAAEPVKKRIKLSKTEGAEPVKKRIKLPKTEGTEPVKKRIKLSNTAPIFVLDVHLLLHEGSDQLVQLGGVILQDNLAQTFFRPVVPDNNRFSLLSCLNMSLDEEAFVFHHDEYEDGLKCYSEEVALKHFLDLCQEKAQLKGGVRLYMSDLDAVMPVMIQKLRQYGLDDTFKAVVPEVADIKTILRSKDTCRFLYSFSWCKFPRIYEHIMEKNTMPSDSSSDVNAKALWVATEELLGVQDLHDSPEFINYFFSSSLLDWKFNSNPLSRHYMKRQSGYCLQSSCQEVALKCVQKNPKRSIF